MEDAPLFFHNSSVQSSLQSCKQICWQNGSLRFPGFNPKVFVFQSFKVSVFQSFLSLFFFLFPLLFGIISIKIGFLLCLLFNGLEILCAISLLQKLVVRVCLRERESSPRDSGSVCGESGRELQEIVDLVQKSSERGELQEILGLLQKFGATERVRSPRNCGYIILQVEEDL